MHGTMRRRLDGSSHSNNGQEHLPLLAADTAHNEARLCITTCGLVCQADEEPYWEMPRSRRSCNHARWHIALSRRILDKVEDQAVVVSRECRQLCA